MQIEENKKYEFDYKEIYMQHECCPYLFTGHLLSENEKQLCLFYWGDKTLDFSNNNKEIEIYMIVPITSKEFDDLKLKNISFNDILKKEEVYIGKSPAEYFDKFKLMASSFEYFERQEYIPDEEIFFDEKYMGEDYAT